MDNEPYPPVVLEVKYHNYPFYVNYPVFGEEGGKWWYTKDQPAKVIIKERAGYSRLEIPLQNVLGIKVIVPDEPREDINPLEEIVHLKQAIEHRDKHCSEHLAKLTEYRRLLVKIKVILERRRLDTIGPSGRQVIHQLTGVLKGVDI